MITNFQNKDKEFLFRSLAIIFIWLVSFTIENLILVYVASSLGCFITFLYITKFFNASLNPIKFLSLSAVGLFFITSLSVIISSYFIRKFYNLNLFEFFKTIQNIPVESYLLAIIFTLLFSLILFIFSLRNELILKENYIFNRLNKITTVDSKKINFMIIFMIFFEIIMNLSGFVEYRDLNNENYKIGVIDPWMPYLIYIFHFHIALTSLITVKYRNKFNLKNSLLIILSVLLIGYFFFTRGRSSFILASIELFFWYCFFNKNAPKLRSIIFSLTIIIPLFYSLTLFNQLLRMSLYTQNDNYKQSLTEQITNAYDLWQMRDMREINSEKNNQNLTFRSLVVTPLAVSIDLKRSQKQHLLGENIFNNFIWTIPRMIYPNKINFPIGELLMVKFGLYFSDTSNSLYLASYIDFWWFGVLIYPMLFYFYWRFLLFILTYKNFDPLIILLILSSAFPIFLNIGEGSILGFIVFMRNSAILLLIFSIFTKNKKPDEISKDSLK